MSDRILDLSTEISPLRTDSQKQGDFWDQYFDLQELVNEVGETEGVFTVNITNHQTGESLRFENIRLSADDGSVVN